MVNKDNLFGQFKNSQNNPYIFSNHSIEEESEEKKQEKYELSDKEREVVREQQLTIFENDETMQKMFQEDFEEYFRAVEDPDLMEKKYRERMQNLHTSDDAPKIEIDDLSDIMPTGDSEDFLDSMDDFGEFDMISEEQEYSVTEKRDKMYEKAFQWSVDITKLCQKIYDKGNRKDADLFRVMINSTMVSAKIAYASDDNDSFFDDMEKDEDFEAFDVQLSLKGYSLSVIFLQRTRDSLKKLIQKKFPPTTQWQEFLKIADELVLEIQSKMVDLAKKLHPPRN